MSYLCVTQVYNPDVVTLYGQFPSSVDSTTFMGTGGDGYTSHTTLVSLPTCICVYTLDTGVAQQVFIAISIILQLLWGHMLLWGWGEGC